MKDSILWVLIFVGSLFAAPLYVGVVRRTKAVFAGRHGQPLLQHYYDLAKMMRKGSVTSTTTSFVFRIAPFVTLGTTILAMLFLPYAGICVPGVVSFEFDFLFFIYIFALGRFMTVLAALDTGSAFAGMGASREVQFSALAEPAFVLALTVLVLFTGETSLSELFSKHELMNVATLRGALVLLTSVALFLVMLSENCRVPFDDPTTHLELTMIHEAMILDYSGPELALIQYGASLKLWVFSALIVLTLIPFHFTVIGNIVIYFAGIFLMAVLVGIVESVTARFRFLKVPQMLVSALALSVFALILVLMGKNF